MRKFLLLTTLALASLATSSFAIPALPRKSPEFVIHLTDGSQKLLSSYRGKTIAMAFMFTTCPHCQKTAGVWPKSRLNMRLKGCRFWALPSTTALPGG